MPEEAGTWLYFEYAAFTLQVAQRERARVPRKRKILSAVIFFNTILLSAPTSKRSRIAVFSFVRGQAG
jgi:hypothetical protein